MQRAPHLRCVTVSMMMSASTGYSYLVRTVAAGDGDRRLSMPLTRYYAEAGTPPGPWLGSGVHALGNGAVVVGETVTQEHLEPLLGASVDPAAGVPLGLLPVSLPANPLLILFRRRGRIRSDLSGWSRIEIGPLACPNTTRP